MRRRAGRQHRVPADGLRVLLVEPDLNENGAVRVSLDRAARWTAGGASVTVLTALHTDPAGAARLPDGLALQHGTSGPTRLRWVVLGGLWRGWRLAHRTDVVVAGRELGPGLLLAYAVARLARRPFAVTVQSHVDHAVAEYVHPRLRGLTRRILGRADLAVCVAAGLVPNLVELGLRPDDVAVVTNGLDVDAVRRSGSRPSAFPLPEGPLVVGTGQLARQKGFDLLVRAHALALRDGAPAHTLLILGEGPDRDQLADLAAELAVSSSVVLPGFVHEPHAVMAKADLFVLPSRWEGFPLALVEAVCLGLSCVAADCVSGPSEVLADGAYGRLVPAEDVEALAAALHEALGSPDELRRRAVDGARAASERFDPAVAAQLHLDRLVQLVDVR